MIQLSFLYINTLVLFFPSLGSYSYAITPSSDKLALLAFKNQINEDPLGALSSWNDSLHYCYWHGITCSHRHPQRVTVLDLDSQKLEGTLSPYIANLTFLTTLILSQNNFHGEIPQELGRLFRLKFLNLTTNSFHGEIPTNLTKCSNLRLLSLQNNQLSGKIPGELSSLSKLVYLGLQTNRLHGSIPSSLGNLSSLDLLSLAYNNLEGSIPSDLCRIQKPSVILLGVNNLSGIIPTCLYNLSYLYRFSFHDNQLHGNLPTTIGLTLPKLERFFVGRNKLTGSIPVSLSNASKLGYLGLEMNAFTGSVPSDLGKLQALRRLYLHSNQLGGDLSFITFLTNCSNLEWLAADNNSLKGSLPNSIGNFSIQFTQLTIALNQIYGSIPSEIQKLVNINVLSAGNNHLTGEIPTVIGMLHKMQELYLHGNQLTGQIPDSFSNLTELSILNLSRNKLHGRIPLSLGNCQTLSGMDLSDNRLNGTIPKQVIGLSSLNIVLNLSTNDLSGSLPFEVANLSNLVSLDVSRNKLSGHIPDSLGNCLTLNFLHLEANRFDGKIPQALSALKGIKELDLSHNKLSGAIPEFLGNFTLLTYLNLSYNEFEGPVPMIGVFANASRFSYVGNSKLCGGVVDLKLIACHINKKGKHLALKVLIPVIVVCLVLVLLLCLLFLLFHRRRMPKKKPSSPSVVNHQYPRISYADLRKATDNFSADNLLGVGSYGSVYKGILDQVTKLVAVKVLNFQRQGASRSFLSECNALRNLRHRNLLKIITACSSVDFKGNDFKALVFEFMPNGSLEEWLHPKQTESHELRNLSSLQRLNIAIDVASALNYLHHDCQPAIVHCDLKPSNVLLDEDMTAHVADFGLAKVFSATPSDSSQSEGSTLGIKGSIGYVAPEYGIGNEVSTQGDVYSYGIFILEMFTGKRPTDAMFQNGLSLHNFAEKALPEQVMNIIDATVLLEENREPINSRNQDGRVKMQECLVSVIKLGVTCSAESPMERMNMGEVVTELCHIKEYHQDFGIH